MVCGTNCFPALGWTQSDAKTFMDSLGCQNTASMCLSKVIIKTFNLKLWLLPFSVWSWCKQETCRWGMKAWSLSAFFPVGFYLGSLPATEPVPPVESLFSGSSEVRSGGGNREGIKEIVTCLILLWLGWYVLLRGTFKSQKTHPHYWASVPWISLSGKKWLEVRKWGSQLRSLWTNLP